MISGETPPALWSNFRTSCRVALVAFALPFAMAQELKPLEAVEVPADAPPENKAAFDIKDRWLEPMTIPAGKERVHSHIVIGDRMKKKWPTMVIAPGSVWTGTKSGRVEISGGNVIARKCRFLQLPLEVDHACRYYFINCGFDDCRFGKTGVWYGGDLAGKYYFESCIIRKNFANPLNLTDTGFRIQNCVLEGIEMPSMDYRKKEPVNYVNEKWLRVSQSRFVKCTIPVSFLLLTRECIFEGCTFTDDSEKIEGMSKPIEVDLYVKDSKSKLKGSPANITLNLKPDTELKDVTVPTTASLLPGLAP
ncbi:hypothetical protein [Luteolibacter luteus]|uniref:Right-handed parallel beta-helix repeat-containing protein n=1 Tax=Luteolibacter luteus TaxID=2728835 RepID=A0A858RRE7_9BACT|nr:hypothetical protein [Luteolibacter luteus]QJE98909.1 hypothetical protein HHL09_25060 [Luteolibacter luteus]